MTERWLPVPFAPEYAVSDLGRVKRIAERAGVRPARLLTPQRRGKGGQYPGVDLRIAGKKTAFYIHRLVALTFIGPPPSEQHEVAHGDGNPANPRLSNLRWAVPVDNNADKHRHGTAQLGEQSSNNKLTEQQAATIRASAEGTASLALRFGVSKSQVKRIRAREDWAHIV